MAKDIYLPHSGGTSNLVFSGLSSECANSFALEPSGTIPTTWDYWHSVTGSVGTYTFSGAPNTSRGLVANTFNASVGDLACSSLDVRVIQPKCPCEGGVAFTASTAQTMPTSGGSSTLAFTTGGCLSISPTVSTNNNYGWTASINGNNVYVNATQNATDNARSVDVVVSWGIYGDSCSQTFRYTQPGLACHCETAVVIRPLLETVPGTGATFDIRYTKDECVLRLDANIRPNNVGVVNSISDSAINVTIYNNPSGAQRTFNLVSIWGIFDGIETIVCDDAYTEITQDIGNCECATSLVVDTSGVPQYLPKEGGSISIPYTSRSCVNAIITSASQGWTAITSGGNLVVYYPRNTQSGVLTAQINLSWNIYDINGANPTGCTTAVTLNQAPNLCYNIDLPFVVGKDATSIQATANLISCDGSKTYEIEPAVPTNSSCGGNISFTTNSLLEAKIMYVDDFWWSDEGYSLDDVVETSCLTTSEYQYTYYGTMSIGGNTYHAWKRGDGSVYALTTTNDFSTLANQSMSENHTNIFSSFVGFVNEGSTTITIPSKPQQLINYSSSQNYLWIGELFLDYNLIDWVNQTVSTSAKSNKYEYYGETFDFEGNTYYLWRRDDAQQGEAGFLLTTTVNYDIWRNYSLADGGSGIPSEDYLFATLLADYGFYFNGLGEKVILNVIPQDY